jgi:hypothetical protein
MLKLTSIALACGALAISLASAQAKVIVRNANNYLCYKVGDYGQPPNAAVKLKDQFDSGEGKFGVPRYLCNPVDVDGSGIYNKKAHLVCYDVKTPMKPKNVEIKNQFQKDKLYLREAELLCIVSLKKILP